MRKLKMQLFGSFTLGDESASVSEQTLHSRKITQILVYLLINRDDTQTQQSLVENFWEDRVSNPEGALKNLIYRARNALKDLGSEEFICTVPGGYQWNPEIEVETDYEEFEQLSEKLQETIPGRDDAERRRVCEELTKSSRGGVKNVTASLANKPWILPRVIEYHTTYLKAAKILCRIYESEKEWTALERLSEKALQVDALDEELNCYQLKALYEQKKYNLALLRYEKAGKLYYERIGIPYPERLKTTFEDLTVERRETAQDLRTFMKEITAQEKGEGAFFCDNQLFRQIYRIELRRVERIGTAGYAMMITVYRDGSLWHGQGEDRTLMEGVRILKKVLLTHLRGGDVATQYHTTQFVVLLMACTYESGLMVAQRIRKLFRRSIGLWKLDVRCELAEIQMPE